MGKHKVTSYLHYPSFSSESNFNAYIGTLRWAFNKSHISDFWVNNISNLPISSSIFEGIFLDILLDFNHFRLETLPSDWQQVGCCVFCTKSSALLFSFLKYLKLHNPGSFREIYLSCISYLLQRGLRELIRKVVGQETLTQQEIG